MKKAQSQKIEKLETRPSPKTQNNIFDPIQITIRKSNILSKIKIIKKYFERILTISYKKRIREIRKQVGQIRMGTSNEKFGL